MTQETMEMVEALDAEVHILVKKRMTDLTENDLVENLFYTESLINKTLRLMLKERLENCDG